MFGCTLAWGIRLTYNFARKGGYNLSSEDYRWPVIRAVVHPILFQIFNLTFIAFYQNILLLLITVPAYVCYLARGTAWNIVDCVAVSLWILLLIGETTADQQQWNFQTAKYPD
jgi:steroid 5-alpha reductase family enzyme